MSNTNTDEKTTVASAESTGSGTPLETQQQLVDLWLSCDDNTARIILKAFKIGVEEGRRCAVGDPDTTLGVLAAFREIMAMLPEKSKIESPNPLCANASCSTPTALTK